MIGFDAVSMTGDDWKKLATDRTIELREWRDRAERAEAGLKSLGIISNERDAALEQWAISCERIKKLESLARELVKSLEYVRRWWDETGRDEGWHQSIGQYVESGLSKAREALK